MRRCTICLFAMLLVLLCVVPLFAQPGVAWNTTFGGPDGDWCWGIGSRQTVDGGFIMIGSTESEGAGEPTDILLVRADEDGTELWSATFGQPGQWEEGVSVLPDGDGGYTVCGFIDMEDPVSDSLVFIRTDANGVELSRVTHSAVGGYNEFNGAKRTSDGGIIAVGELDDYFFLLRLDGDLEILWWETFGGDGIDDDGFDVIELSSGGFAGVGYNRSSSANEDQDFWLIVVDGNGALQWDATYGDGNEQEASVVLETTDGGFLIGGDAADAEGNAYAWLVRTESEGTVIWDHTFPGGGAGIWDIFSLYEDDEGSLYIGIVAVPEDLEQADELLYKLDSGGNEVWSTTYGGDRTDLGAFVPTGDGGFALLGATNSWGFGDMDFWLLKTEPLTSVGEGGLTDALPAGFSVIDAYPNPFNSTVRLPFSLHRAGGVEVMVYDILGRRVATLLRGALAAGRHEAVWSADGLAAGTYLVRLSLDGKTVASRRVSYVK